MVVAADLGRYELLIELGRGGMAELFLGRLRGAGGFAKLVAIKRILPHLAQDRLFTEMFLDEGRIASRLSHPNVCQVFELGEDRGTLFLAMEYLDGVSSDHLVTALPADPRFRARLVAGVLGQAADGLHYAHTLRDVDGTPTPVVHRDVSPQNLFVTVDGVCKVLDFGVSKMMTDGPRTRTGVVKGKLPYMSPEQIRGEPLDGRGDVFALGVCAWEALAGARLYDRDTDFLIWKAITEHAAPPLASAWPACPPALAAVVDRALQRDRDHRQPSAQVFAEELRTAAGFAGLAELAEAVRTLCAARLAERAHRVATAVGDRGGTPAAVADRDQPVTAAGVTLDLAAQQAGAVRMRSEAVVVRREPPTPPTAVAAAPGDSFAAAIHRRKRGVRSRGGSHVKTAAIAAAIAAAITAIVVVIVMTRGSSQGRVARERASDAAPAGPFQDLRESLQDLETSLAPLRDLGDRVHGTGRYRVDSRPSVKIFANAEPLGDTPVRAELAAGTYTIRAVHEDGREQTLTVEIKAGEETRSDLISW